MTNYLDRSIESLLARRALAEKATPGRWDVIENLENQTQCSVRIISPKHHIVLRDDWITFADALFIVRHSPDVVMADIDEILRLREEVDRLEKEADWLAERASAVRSRPLRSGRETVGHGRRSLPQI